MTDERARVSMEPTASRGARSIACWVLLGATALGCNAGGSAADVDDPMALGWVAPADDARLEIGDPVELRVTTADPSAVVVHFEVDGHEVAVCDSSDASADCFDGTDWSWATSFSAPGAHTLGASYTNAAGAAVTVSRAIDILPTGAAPGSDGEGSADEADPGTNSVAQSIVSARGYLDPSHGLANPFGGIRWNVVSARVQLEPGRALPRGSMGDVQACVGRYDASIRRYADLSDVSRASVVATMIADSSCGLYARRGFGRRLANISGATCAAVWNGISGPRDGSAPVSPAACAARMDSSPDFAIDVIVLRLASGSLVRQHHHDPPLIAAAHGVGAVTAQRGAGANRWHFASPDRTGRYIDRWVAAYDAYRSWEGVCQPSQLASSPSSGIAMCGFQAGENHTAFWMALSNRHQAFVAARDATEADGAMLGLELQDIGLALTAAEAAAYATHFAQLRSVQTHQRQYVQAAVDLGQFIHDHSAQLEFETVTDVGTAAPGPRFGDEVRGVLQDLASSPAAAYALDYVCQLLGEGGMPAALAATDPAGTSASAEAVLMEAIPRVVLETAHATGGNFGAAIGALANLMQPLVGVWDNSMQVAQGLVALHSVGFDHERFVDSFDELARDIQHHPVSRGFLAAGVIIDLLEGGHAFTQGDIATEINALAGGTGSASLLCETIAASLKDFDAAAASRAASLATHAPDPSAELLPAEAAVDHHELVVGLEHAADVLGHASLAFNLITSALGILQNVDGLTDPGHATVVAGNALVMVGTVLPFLVESATGYGLIVAGAGVLVQIIGGVIESDHADDVRAAEEHMLMVQAGVPDAVAGTITNGAQDTLRALGVDMHLSPGHIQTLAAQVPELLGNHQGGLSSMLHASGLASFAHGWSLDDARAWGLFGGLLARGTSSVPASNQVGAVVAPLSAYVAQPLNQFPARSTAAVQNTWRLAVLDFLASLAANPDSSADERAPLQFAHDYLARITP